MNLMTWTSLVALVFFALTPVVEAQQSTQPKRVGVVSGGFPATSATFIAQLREGLRDHGWVDGQNVVIEARFAEGKPERIGERAAELVLLPVDVLVTSTVPTTLAVKKATQTIPIVVASATDPAGTGLVTPGGNVAGFDTLPADSAARQLGVLREVVPGLSHLAVVWNGSNPASRLNAQRAKEAAGAVGLQVIPVEVQDPAQLEVALSGLRDKGAQATFVVADPRFFGQRKRIGELTTATGLPTICQERDFGDAGCVIAYGPHILHMWRQSASYVDRILRGTRAADLPIGPPTRFELVIHAGSAKAIGLTIPTSVLNRADAIVR